MDSQASIVIPTRRRLPYLEVTLESIRDQAAGRGVEIVVVDDDGESAGARALVERCGAHYEPHRHPMGLNAARNTGVRRSTGSLVVFLDDDVCAHEGWLGALLQAARGHPGTDVFAGRITARLEGPAPRSCGREKPPITTLDLGERDVPTRFAWGSNMAIRRSALERVGPFDETLQEGGDEQEWQERALAGRPGAPALYVGAAWVEHRRAGEDARLRALCRSARARGRAARRFDAGRGRAPSAAAELATLGGCLGHVLRRNCPAGLTMAAHSAGRLSQALNEGLARRHVGPWRRAARDTPATETRPPASTQPDFLSGTSGTVGGLDGLRRRAGDELAAAGELLSGRQVRLALAARHDPPRRRVLALGVVRPEHRELAAAIRAELESSRHDVRLHTSPPGAAGKFENLNRLLAQHPAEGHDWLLVIDDDVELPHGFLDRFVFLSERFSLTLAQPAHRLHSHAAWDVTRRRPGSVVRETSFVEIGPVTAFASACFPVLLPFPELRMGWGLDVHWAAVAREQGWRCGVLDAVTIRHRQAPAGAAYPREAAIAEATSFLAGRPHLSAAEAQRTLATHTRW
ncbi:MAG: glycosyltransferase family 2 protein [Solirubrobacteraceae bacterium]